jgi:hypothetical protein
VTEGKRPTLRERTAQSAEVIREFGRAAHRFLKAVEEVHTIREEVLGTIKQWFPDVQEHKAAAIEWYTDFAGRVNMDEEALDGLMDRSICPLHLSSDRGVWSTDTGSWVRPMGDKWVEDPTDHCGGRYVAVHEPIPGPDIDELISVVEEVSRQSGVPVFIQGLPQVACPSCSLAVVVPDGAMPQDDVADSYPPESLILCPFCGEKAILFHVYETRLCGARSVSGLEARAAR